MNNSFMNNLQKFVIEGFIEFDRMFVNSLSVNYIYSMFRSVIQTKSHECCKVCSSALVLT